MLTIKGKPFKDSPWYDNGALPFYDSSYRNWRAAVAAPLAKCKELFPHLEMVLSPWPNVWVPKVDLDRAQKRLNMKGA